MCVSVPSVTEVAVKLALQCLTEQVWTDYGEIVYIRKLEYRLNTLLERPNLQP